MIDSARMRRAVILSGVLLSLTACKFPFPGPSKAVAPVVPPSPPVAVSSDAASSESALEFGDAVVSASSASNASASSQAALPERMIDDGVHVGAESAPFTLYVFTHHSCRYCRDVWETLFPRLRSDYIDTGRLAVVIVPVQLKKYPESARQSVGLRCAAAQGKGAAMHGLLFTHAVPDDASLLVRAKSLALDEAAFRDCLQSDRTRNALVKQDILAQGWQVTLVPSFALTNRTHPTEDFRVLDRFTGLPTYADLRGRIEKAL